MSIRVLIADDEALARERMRQLLDKFDGVDIVGEAGDGDAAVEQCRTLQPDAVFLDIRMPGLNGLDVADFLRDSQIAVVFVSAYDEHALAAFEVKAVDYLTKPVRPSRLAETLARIRERMPSQSSEAVAEPDATTQESKLAIPTGEGHELIDRDDIRYAQVAHGLLEMVCKQRTYHLTWTLKQLEDKLDDDDRFVKISRQALVRFGEIAKLETQASGTGLATLRDGVVLDVSRTAAKALRRRLG